MKNSPYHKLLKLCISQILLQNGFIKSSDKALNALTDIASHVIFQISNNPTIAENKNFSLKELEDYLKGLDYFKGAFLHDLNLAPRESGKTFFEEGLPEDLCINFGDWVYEFVENNKENQEDVEIESKSEEIEDFDLLRCFVGIKKGNPWMNEKEYFSVLDYREKNKKILTVYENGTRCDIIDELKGFLPKEVDKKRKD